MMNIVHAASSRGIKRCGSTTSGDERVNVEKYPGKWWQVTCTACLETKGKDL